MTLMSRLRILVIEDDAAIRRGIIDALQYEGYQTLVLQGIDDPPPDRGVILDHKDSQS